MSLLKILLIICAIIIAVIAIAVIAFYSTTPKVATITSSELNSTGNCTIVNTQVKLANNESTISCNVGERFEGFKLLKVNPTSIQILIYDDCGACMHNATNGNQFVEIMNVNVFQSFGSPCEGIPPTQLVMVNIKNNVSTAIFHSNISGTMYCV